MGRQEFLEEFSECGIGELYTSAGFLKTVTGKYISGSGACQRAAGNIHVGRRARYTSDMGGEPAARIASFAQNGSPWRHQIYPIWAQIEGTPCKLASMVNKLLRVRGSRVSGLHSEDVYLPWGEGP